MHLRCIWDQTGRDTKTNSNEDRKCHPPPHPPHHWRLTLGPGSWCPHSHCVAKEVMQGDTHRESFPGNGFRGQLIIHSKPLCMWLKINSDSASGYSYVLKGENPPIHTPWPKPLPEPGIPSQDLRLSDQTLLYPESSDLEIDFHGI